MTSFHARRALATMRKLTWMRDGDAEHRLESGTMLRGAELVHDRALVEAGLKPGTARLVFDRRSRRELQHANRIFQQSKVVYKDSFVDANQVIQCTETLPEIIFMGRSNCGKSSLLNAVLGKTVAQVSNTPGRTRSANRFVVDSKFIVIDAPGYGFAQASKDFKNTWLDMEAAFYNDRSSLSAVLLLLDCRRGITAVDQLRIDEMERHGVNYQFILTKADTASPSELATTIRQLEAEARGKSKRTAAPWVVATSARVGSYGVGELRANICECAGIKLDYDAEEARREKEARTRTVEIEDTIIE